MEIDHAFICTEFGAPAADLLVDFGLSEGESNSHPGQGTANRRFFFDNFMLELLWLADPQEALSERTRPTGLHQRCLRSDPAVSPFGLGFRPSRKDGDSGADFATWDYRPLYLPDSLAIQAAQNTALREPFLFYLPFVQPRDEAASAGREAKRHAVGWRALTALAITVVGAPPLSEAAQKVAALPSCRIECGSVPLLELEFDHGTGKQVHDFAPALPLVCRW